MFLVRRDVYFNGGDVYFYLENEMYISGQKMRISTDQMYIPIYIYISGGLLK